jgi:hypothetical protein
MQQPFSYVSVGPTVLAPLVLTAGAVIREHYVVDVADGALSAPRRRPQDYAAG